LRTIEVATDRRDDIIQAFFESLNPNEIKTKRFAHNLKIKTFGYSNFSRAPGVEKSWAQDGRSALNRNQHEVMTAETIDKFGSFPDLLTADELKRGDWNIMDVMGRLNPRYVLRRFESKGEGFEYLFVVTEDGQLKICPAHGPDVKNLKAQGFRLAHGRRVFAAGNFTLDARGNVSIKLDSNDFQSTDATWGSGSAFKTPGNENLGPFLSMAFELQTGRKVSSVDAYPVERYFTFSRTSTAGRPDKEPDEPEFVNEYTSKKRARSAGYTAAKWDPKDPNSRPLDFDEWLKATGRDKDAVDRASKLEHAHYVLQTNSDMTFQDIKKSKRKLAGAFFADRETDPKIKEKFSRISQIINDAYALIERDIGGAM
jgi:hypothetical protein